ncbi:MAG: recombinase family protein [bacterium]|nr:recombinase family protein [bacterium]
MMQKECGSTQKKRRAALYARVSTQDQAREEKVSLETQISDIERYCRDRDYDLVTPHYIDIQSGSDNLKDRPQFENMLLDAKNRNFDVIVTWRPDRLYRNMWPAARLKRTIDESGVDVEAVTQPLDKSTIGMYAFVAEMEVDNFRERSKMGKRGVAHKGQIVTKGVPYGYQINKDRYPEINEAEACIVRRIFQEYKVEDKPARWIANGLNNDNVPLRTGKTKFGWSTPYIYRILKNKTYIGDGVYGAYTYSGKKCRPTPKEDQIQVPFPPIIDKALFEATQEKKNRRIKSVEHHYQAFYLLRDIAYCRECGYKFLPRDQWSHTKHTKSGKKVKQRYDKPYQYYTCYAMFRYYDRFSCRKPVSLRAHELDNLVWNKVAAIIQNPSVVQKAIGVAQGHDEKLEITKNLESLKRQVHDFGRKRQQAIDLQIRGVITEQDLSIQLKLFKEKLEFFESEVERLSSELVNVQKKQINLTTLDNLSKYIKDRVSNLTDNERLRLVRLLVNRVWVDGQGKVEIEFAIPESITETKPEAISDPEHVFPLSNGDTCKHCSRLGS